MKMPPLLPGNGCDAGARCELCFITKHDEFRSGDYRICLFVFFGGCHGLNLLVLPVIEDPALDFLFPAGLREILI